LEITKIIIFDWIFHKFLSTLIILTVFFMGMCAANLNKNPTANSMQMLLVTTENWNTTNGELQIYERPSTQSSWHKVGKIIPVVLGAKGMGWGIGLAPANLANVPEISEGSKKTPAGAFAIERAFGKDSAKTLGAKLPYQQITPTLFCPDDPQSKFYNQVVDTKKVTPDWHRAENMYQIMQQGFYTYAIPITHNYQQPTPGRGSCFFIHAYTDPNYLTQGCTAIDSKELKQIIVWLDIKKHPILVQLPATIFPEFKKRWQLPDLA
jgi:L,D-peptidoglycan transpeptidase YkuD (ErfK/YbiS/YcfS/YnhG family)